ncbi:hypothetical protein DPMN_088186 [Dreissena polymorpha]|uniref:Uncharacterized protein n=1 Tax=Dreissena polymorpha TaxID=45954 RepID=A0A9D4QW66_DREPO|nr:hypothetical protein DPMN_088186 [Dreissena polymorpha]
MSDCPALKKTKLLRQGSTDNIQRSSRSMMAAIDVTIRRPEPQNGFPSTLSVLSATVMGHLHYLHPLEVLLNCCFRSVPSVLAASTLPRCSHPSSDDLVNSLSNFGQLPFRLLLFPSSGSQRSQREMTSVSMDDGTR